MRDDQTGTFWQQISGRGISGPLAGQSLKLIPSDELTLGLWESEQPGGTVMKDVTAYAAEYSPKDWDVRMKKQPTVISFPEHGLAQRDLVLGIQAFGEARAFPYEKVVAQKLVKDQVGSNEVLLVTGSDDKSVRAFRADGDFYRVTDDPAAVMMDSETGSRWNFRGCAVAGSLKGKCLERVEAIADYWFDWRNYHPTTTVYTK